MKQNHNYSKDPQTIQTMFNLIAGKYDMINNVMSFKTQNYIKYKSIKNLNIKPHNNVIDLCCGTGDLAIFVKEIQPEANVVGIDFSEKMLEIANNKNSSNKIQYLQGDVTNLPYADDTFDFVVMGFGLTNILNAEKAVDEAYRILKPGGCFMHLDFGTHNFLSKIYDIITPISIRFFTENAAAYSYLIESKKQFPEPNDLIKDFKNKGFKLKGKTDYLFGVISTQTLVK